MTRQGQQMIQQIYLDFFSGCCGEIVAVRELPLLLFQVKVLQAVAERSCCVVPGYHRSSSSGRPLQKKLILQASTSVDTTPGLCRHHSWTVLIVYWKPELVSTPPLDCVDTTASFVLTVCWKTSLVSTPPLDCVDTPLDCVNTTVNCVDTTVTCVDITMMDFGAEELELW
ncbi:hypothetical protein Taro_012319 [Colocasia esculenta]|uniref:Uncharacterized protein n=1 Tax=Colocasia esculenta TaxID=4460 RepID=A0A843UCI4_COLES|nr:hypothetical protein [Colocasia esculenta]